MELRSPAPQSSSPRLDARSVVVVMLRALQADRAETVAALMRAVAQMVAEIDPNGERDHRSHWDATVAARRTRPDLFDRVRWSADELVVLGAQMANTVDLTVFAVLVQRETDPLVRLERDVPTLQLQRRFHPDLRAAELPKAVKALRYQHAGAEHVLRLLGKIAA